MPNFNLNQALSTRTANLRSPVEKGPLSLWLLWGFAKMRIYEDLFIYFLLLYRDKSTAMQTFPHHCSVVWSNPKRPLKACSAVRTKALFFRSPFTSNVIAFVEGCARTNKPACLIGLNNSRYCKSDSVLKSLDFYFHRTNSRIRIGL